ncbi:sialate O-acetylesterase [Parafilimonas sp.]|uniref:sialate O-acetylesterase n=1 Tax=Parafilimonas sp. TaxID=1969739 RepID=UPI003F7FDAFC
MKYGSFIILLFISLYAKSNIRLPDVINNNMVLQQQSEVKLWGWGEPNEKVAVTTSWDNKTYAPVTVSGNAEWELKIKTPAAGGPYKITLAANNKILLSNVMIGEVWVCSGQSNMEMCGNWGLQDIKQELPVANHADIRFFKIAKATASFPQKNCTGNWDICDSNTLKEFSAVAYFFGKHLQQKMNVPIGLIEAAWGGTSAEVWTPDSIIQRDTFLQQASAKIAANGQCPNLPGYAYNAMIAPITNFSVAGTIWYQGENNTINAYAYKHLFTSMIDAWRRRWNNNMPFYFVQIAPFSYALKNTGALLREAQSETSNYTNVGMVVINDLVSDVHNVHPSDKHNVGLRLANWALGDHYNISGTVYKSPVLKDFHINQNKIIITIDNAPNGLKLKGKKATGLFVAGADSIFYPAEVVIKKNILEVWSKKVSKPIAARYCFSDTATGNIFSEEELPLAPFRTDKWPVKAE